MKDSNGTELNIGDEGYCSDVGTSMLHYAVGTHRIVGMTKKGLYVVETDGETLHTWEYYIKKEEPKLIPWTIDTVPIPYPVVRYKKDFSNHSIVATDSVGITIVDANWDIYGCRYEEVADKMEVVNPDRTTSPCGVMK